MSAVQVWSCGGGTQSGAIATLIRLGQLPKPDLAFMTDTGRERTSTWHFVDRFIRPSLETVGVDLTIVQATEFARIDVILENTTLLPGYTTQSGALGKLRPFCSGKWKQDVGERWMRAQGITHACNWIGISVDEATRVRSKHRAWLDLFYPLISRVPMRRHQCVQLIKDQGWTDPIPHSSCWCCPNHSDAEWIDMKLNWPEDFQQACDLEAEIRLSDPHFYMHPSCIPLAQVDFFAQRSMLSERGCYGECFT